MDLVLDLLRRMTPALRRALRTSYTEAAEEGLRVESVPAVCVVSRIHLVIPATSSCASPAPSRRQPSCRTRLEPVMPPARLCATQCVAARSAESPGRAAETFHGLRALRVHETAAPSLRCCTNRPDGHSAAILQDKIGTGHASSMSLWRAP